jgi:hypothetical protein
MRRRLRRAPAARMVEAERTRHVVRFPSGLECVVTILAGDARIADRLDRAEWVVRDYGVWIVAVRVEACR